MLGRPGIWLPVMNSVMPGEWLIASVCIDLMKQISSAAAPMPGSSSLSQAPLCPCRLNLNSVGWIASFCLAVIVVSRWPIRTDGGSSLPRHAFRPGL